eukprot:c17446_g1_i7.p1 GENE.c17446_g1_i7~~c17446_g1_i7.p1  ORF type:complete len:112 (+),score=10.94 c17446_g1_i7:108-443(+)
MDATRKKTLFLDQTISEMGLQNVSVVWGRAELLGHSSSHRSFYDVVVARAVAELRILLELCAPFAKLGGHLFLPKRLSPTFDEVGRASNAIDRLGETANKNRSADIPCSGL